MTPEEEFVGADYWEHNLGPRATREYAEKIGIIFPRRDSLNIAHRSAFGTRKMPPYPDMNVIAEEQETGCDI